LSKRPDTFAGLRTPDDPTYLLGSKSFRQFVGSVRNRRTQTVVSVAYFREFPQFIRGK